VLLGFGGRYSMGNKGDLQAIINAVGEKIARVRGRSVELSPSWRLPNEALRSVGGDPWVRKLTIAAAVCLALAIVLFAIFKFSLGSGISELSAMAGRTP